MMLGYADFENPLAGSTNPTLTGSTQNLEVAACDRILNAPERSQVTLDAGGIHRSDRALSVFVARSSNSYRCWN